MTLTVGAICAGYGGLELALSHAGVDHTLGWVSEIDATACAVLAERFSTVPNLGDINHAEPEPVDIITAGFPCQDISVAGRGRGLDGERSGLWWRIRDVVGDLRPRFVLLENVARIRRLGGPEVIGSLAAIGYDCRWVHVRAADIGAPHRRERWFCLAWDVDGPGLEGIRPRGATTEPRGDAADTDGAGWVEPFTITGRGGAAVAAADRSTAPDADGMAGSPTGKRPAGFGQRDGRRRQRTNPSTHHTVADTDSRRRETGGGDATIGDQQLRGDADRRNLSTFGRYAAAVTRWEQLTRPAPVPSINGMLNPRFVEWMMGLPESWVCGVPAIAGQTRLFESDATDETAANLLRCLGNGVVPQQAAAALKILTYKRE